MGNQTRISPEVASLHDKIVELGSDAQTRSSEKKETKNHIEDHVFAVFYKVGEFAITLHRAVLALCKGGWTPTTPLLLRALLECSANCLAVVNNNEPCYMAFKYLYYPYLELMKDTNFAGELRDNSAKAIEAGMLNIKDLRIRAKAEKFAMLARLPRYWFQPEENSISSIIRKYGGAEQLFVYKSLSTATHGYHFGMGLFKDNADDITINPSINPKRTKHAILFSCRLLLDFIYIRDSFEGLGLESRYDELVYRIIAFKKEEK